MNSSINESLRNNQICGEWKKVMAQKAKILIVDDDEGSREALEEILADEHDVQAAPDGLTALEEVQSADYDVVLLDLIMPGIDGIETLIKIKEIDPSIDVIMVSATDKAREATSSIKSGAYDYITKPFDAEAILSVVKRVMEKRNLEQEIRVLRSEVASHSDNYRIIGESDSIRTVLALVKRVAAANSSILITGESGTGKELVARAVHRLSPRAERPFVAVNCAAIPAELVESEVFGHEKGSFTGAYTRNIGKFELASRGTVFMDEISSLKLESQAKLLRFLQEREFTRVGGHRNIRVDVRMIAATNLSLKKLVADGRFREDLYFRLNVIPIELPSLQERNGDIPLLVVYFLKKFNQQLHQKIEGITPEAMALLEAYHWPGNIRELENMIERLVVLRSDERRIDVKDLPLELFYNQERSREISSFDAGLIDARNQFERRYILRALKLCNWNQAKTARMLSIHRNTLIQKMKSLHIVNRPGS